MQNDFYVQFDNYDLNNIPNLFLVKRDPNEMPEVETVTVPIIRGEGEVMVSRNYRHRNISITGYIIAPSRVAYEQTVDELKFRIGGIERPLILQQAGSDRRYTATVQNLTIGHIEGGKASVGILFRCANPFGRSSTEVVYSETFTTSPHTHSSLIYEGSAPAQPKIRVKINSVTGGTTKTVTVGNGFSTQAITVTRTWVADDILEVDTFNRSVTINGDSVDYDGAFASFEPGSSPTLYSDNFTARNVTVTVTYTKNYR